MLEELRCRKCHALLAKTSLTRHPHVEIKCYRCGRLNTWDYDPSRYVRKDDAPTRPLFDQDA